MARVIVPHAYGVSSTQADLTGLVGERIVAAPPDISRDIMRVLDLLNSRVANVLLGATLTPLANLTAAERTRVFHSWGTSSVPLARTAHQAIRQLVLSTYYATPDGRRVARARAPLHTRAPAVPWEGPVPRGVTVDSEPVARASTANVAILRSTPESRPVPPNVTLGSALRGDVTITADVVIVGSGAGGAVAAARLAEAGRDVLILEAGEYLHAPDFTENEGEMMPRLFAEQALRGTVDASISLLQGGAVGGGTTVNWMLMLRTPDQVLDEWERGHGISGLGPAVMGPELDRIERDVHARVVPEDAHSPSNQLILDGAKSLGWRAAAVAINATGCVRAGTCSLGCRYDAKQSALLTYLPRAFAAGARLYANARAERVEVLERSTASSATPPLKRVHAIAVDRRDSGKRARLIVEAPVVILAGGAVETPALLQRSGLGGGGVGRYLRLHPTTAILGRYERELYMIAGIPQTVMCDHFIQRDRNQYGFWIECPALQPALAAAALTGFGEEHRAGMAQLDRAAAFIVLVRDGSGDDASDGAVWVDRRGRTRVRYVLRAADRENLVAGVEAAARLHLAAGASEVLTLHTPSTRVRSVAELGAIRNARFGPNRISLFSAHVNGTCRLGVSPAKSGTTPDGQRHGVRGLYVCDGSLLPTSLGVNPQETIMALASVVSTRIAEQ